MKDNHGKHDNEGAASGWAPDSNQSDEWTTGDEFKSTSAEGTDDEAVKWEPQDFAVMRND